MKQLSLIVHYLYVNKRGVHVSYAVPDQAWSDSLYKRRLFYALCVKIDR